MLAPRELQVAVRRHYEAGGAEDGVASNRSEVRDVPELLMFALQAATPAADLGFHFGPTAGDDEIPLLEEGGPAC